MCACGSDKRPGFLICCNSLKKEKPNESQYVKDLERFQELKAFIGQCLLVGMSIPLDWIEEYNALAISLRDKNRRYD